MGGGTLAVESDVSYTGEHYFSITNYSATRVAGYAVTDARVSWSTADKHWEFAGFVDNLTDKRYETVGFDLTQFAGSNFAQIAFGKPRWAGGSVRYRFN